MRSRCGFPGLPFNSTMQDMKKFYAVNDAVHYTCDDFKMPKYSLTCGDYGWNNKPRACPVKIFNMFVTEAICESTTSKIRLLTLPSITPKNNQSDFAYKSDEFESKIKITGTGRFDWSFKLSRSSVKFVGRTEFFVHNFFSLSERIVRSSVLM